MKELRVKFDLCFSMSQHLLQLIEMMLIDTTHILKIMYELNVIPLALQITTICGNVMVGNFLFINEQGNNYFHNALGKAFFFSFFFFAKKINK